MNQPGGKTSTVVSIEVYRCEPGGARVLASLGEKATCIYLSQNREGQMNNGADREVRESNQARGGFLDLFFFSSFTEV